MKFHKTTHWSVVFKSSLGHVAHIEKRDDEKFYRWWVTHKELDLGFGDAGEWIIDSEGKTDTLCAAQNIILLKKKEKER